MLSFFRPIEDLTYLRKRYRGIEVHFLEPSGNINLLKMAEQPGVFREFVRVRRRINAIYQRPHIN